MQITIFDVAHGSCAYIVADNGNTMLVDCADNAESGFNIASFLTAVGCKMAYTRKLRRNEVESVSFSVDGLYLKTAGR